MKQFTSEYFLFAISSELESKLTEYTHKKFNYGIKLLMLIVVLILLLLVAASLAEDVLLKTGLAIIAVTAFGAIFAVAIWVVSIKKIACPLCGKPVEFRRKHVGPGGDEMIVGICLNCRIQGNTNVTISG